MKLKKIAHSGSIPGSVSLSGDDVLTVSQLTRKVKEALESGFRRVNVTGEISNFHRHASGHLYFTLKDAGAQLSAVMFRASAASMFFRPENGMEVLCRGAISVYEARGVYQIIVSSLQPKGVGSLQAAFEKLKQKLSEEGLFDDSRKRLLPEFPKRVALVTSGSGAAVRDMISVMRRRDPSVELVMIPVQVQGAGAADQISSALDMCNEYGEFDVIVTGRGGGSIEDLWAFNEEITARAIARSRIPVVSAVGHEVDVTISDYVADVRAATPSVAGEIVIPARGSRQAMLEDIAERTWKVVDLTLQRIQTGLRASMQDRALRRPEAIIRDLLQLLDDRFLLFERSFGHQAQKKNHDLELVTEKLAAFDPERIFKRGVAIIRRDEETVTSIGQIVAGDSIHVIFLDGWATALIQEKHQAQEKHPGSGENEYD